MGEAGASRGLALPGAIATISGGSCAPAGGPAAAQPGFRLHLQHREAGEISGRAVSKSGKLEYKNLNIKGRT